MISMSSPDTNSFYILISFIIENNLIWREGTGCLSWDALVMAGERLGRLDLVSIYNYWMAHKE